MIRKNKEESGAQVGRSCPRTGAEAAMAREDVLSTEKGIALVMVLILSAIALAIMAALVYMLVASTQVSGIQKRYRTALEAGKGGAEVAYRLIASRGIPSLTGITINTGAFASNACMTAKMNSSTYTSVGGTTTYNWGACGSTAADITNATSVSIDPTNAATYDMSADIGTGTVYRVYTKIVDTVEGNSGADLGLIKSGVVNSNPGEVQVVSRPYLYSLEIDAQNRDNPQERAKYSILYEY